MLIMTSLIRVGQSPFASVPIDEDSVERITICLQSLASFSSQEEEKPVKEIFLEDTQKAYAKMVANEEKKAAEKRAKSSTAVKVQPDDLISFRQFSKKQGDDVDEVRDNAACLIATNRGLTFLYHLQVRGRARKGDWSGRGGKGRLFVQVEQGRSAHWYARFPLWPVRLHRIDDDGNR
jgi:hypothetical protein